MKPLGLKDRRRLAAIVAAVRNRLKDTPLDSRLDLLKENPQPTDTYGWACSVARLSGTVKADFELWLDLLPNIGRPVLSVSFWAANSERVLQVAAAHTGTIRRRADFDNHDLLPSDNGHQRMRSPLPSKCFNKPVVEFYDNPFLTVYLSTRSQSRSSLVNASLRFLKLLIGAAVVVAQDELPITDKERKLLRRHEAWERSPVIAWQAKLRDGFTCTVCGFNFGAVYGDIGRGFAEAHHKKPLAFLRSKSARCSADDLVTVCANCHRMLHRFKKKVGAINILKRTIETKRRPRRSAA